MVYNITPDSVEVTVDAMLYPEAVIYKCVYWYTGYYEVVVETQASNTYKIIFTAKPGVALLPEQLIGKLRKDLVDFKLRHIVTQETKTVRELIIAKAFAYYDLAQNPVTDVSDPVGFKPEAIH